jgi:hypothetical protein
MDIARDLDKMVQAYAVCALWSSFHWDDMADSNPTPLDDAYGVEDLSPQAMAEFERDCLEFARDNADDLTAMDPGQAGHDLWLTRNGHGAGFWDRGLGNLGRRLTDAAHAYGEIDLYVADDGLIYA